MARSLGAEVPFMRSEKTSNDFATTEDALTDWKLAEMKYKLFFAD